MNSKAIFAAGCFWGVEASFRELDGVVNVRVGYTGGHAPNPDYESVCRGDSGHAEAAEVEFDSGKISYERLLAAFWAMHDPTQLNRQGPDVGSQYRSAIFYLDDSQRAVAEASKAAERERRDGEVVTVIESAGEFWLAEEYHQDYVRKRRRFGFF